MHGGSFAESMTVADDCGRRLWPMTVAGLVAEGLAGANEALDRSEAAGGFPYLFTDLVAFQLMLIINLASATGCGYWQRSAVHSCWLGQGAEILGLFGEVRTADLRAVMLGQRPSSSPPAGEALTSRPGLRRRHGWDLIFAAPKSVSLLAQAGALPAASALREANRLAVSDAMGTLEERAAWVRASGAQVTAEGVVAAAFEHLDNDAGHPHLHTHVVLANLAARGNGQWSCLVGNELWRWREGLGAGFHLALRSRLAEAGLGFRWAISGGGLGEITSVPLEARSVTSSRSRGVRAAARSFGSGSAATERGAQARTRRSARSTGTGSVGWDEAEAAKVLRRALRSPAQPSPPPAVGPVAAALAGRGSTFGEADVLVALAETLPSGLNLRQATDWARSWCETNRPLVPAEREGAARPQTPKRWTTALADHLDQRVVALATEARFAHMAQVMPALAGSELAGLGAPAGVASEAMRLACGPDGVAILPRGPWLAQAFCIDAARAAWQSAGVTVELVCPSELSARRWRALTSLRERSGGGAGLGVATGGRRPDHVLVVDAADHLSPGNLVRLLDQAAAGRTKVILVLGGTAPGHGPSLARSLDELAGQLASAGIVQRPLLGPASVGAAANPAVSLPGIVVHGSLTGADAMAQVVQAWVGRAGPDQLSIGPSSIGPSSIGPGSIGAVPLMVAFGPAEAEALNLAARPAWLRLRAGLARAQRAGLSELSRAPLSDAATSDAAREVGAEMALGERRYAVGDRVVALRRIGHATSATFGSVVALGDRSITVEWQGPGGLWQSEVGAEQARSLGYGYATTVPYLRACNDPRQRFVVLGDPLELAARADRAVGAWVTVPGPGWPAFGASGAAARHRAAVRELATSWPDKEMLELAGPRPLGLAGRRRWAEIVVSCAIRRELGLSNGGLARRDPAELGVADLGVAGLGVAGLGVAGLGVADVGVTEQGVAGLPLAGPSARRPGAVRPARGWPGPGGSPSRQQLPSPHAPGL
jgi:conjugative relaxase-like TrwC/TraI family protein